MNPFSSPIQGDPNATSTIPGNVEFATDAETQTGTATNRAITPANLQACTATETRKGVAELATDAEVTTGSDTSRIVTPAGLQQKTASDSALGIVELATSAETITGTDSTRVVTPAGLSARLEGAPTTLSGTFTGFTAAEAKTLNLTGALSNYPTVTFIRLWVSNDPGADTNINAILTFYNSDSLTEDERILKPKFLNVTYTETNGGISATDTTDTVDSGAGLIDGDKVRLMGGTAEVVTLTATPTATGLTFTAATQAHADNTGIVKVCEFDTVHRLYDADASSEIHAKLELLSAPNASMNVYMEIDILT